MSAIQRKTITSALQLQRFCRKYKRQIAHEKHPRSILRFISDKTESFIRTRFTGTDMFDSFDDLEQRCISDHACRTAERRMDKRTEVQGPLVNGPPNSTDLSSTKLQQLVDARVSRIRTAYAEKQFQVLKDTIQQYNDPEMTKLVKTVMAERVTAAMREVVANGERYIAKNKDSDIIGGIGEGIPYIEIQDMDGEDLHAVVPVNEEEDPRLHKRHELNTTPEETRGGEDERFPQRGDDLISYLIEEADFIVPHLVTAFLQRDVGARFVGMQRDWATTDKSLYGRIGEHREALEEMEDIIDAHNPNVDAAGFERVPDAMIRRLIKRAATKGYEEDARTLYTELVEGEDEWRTPEEVLRSLRNLRVDHEGNVIVPWRAFACTPNTSSVSNKPNGQEQGQRQGQSQGQSQAQSQGQDTSGQRRKGSGYKPLAQKDRTNADPWHQFKDREHYFIKPAWKQYCDTHGYNGSHDTTACKAKSPETRDMKPESSTQVDAKPEPARAKPGWVRNGAGRLEKTNTKGQGNNVVQTKSHRRQPGKLVCMEVLINDTPVSALLDPGSTTSTVSLGTLHHMGNRLPLEQSEACLVGAGDEQISIGKVALTHTIELAEIQYRPTVSDWPLEVTKGKTQKVLIGADILRELGLLTEEGIFIRFHHKDMDDGHMEGLPEHQYLTNNAQEDDTKQGWEEVNIADDFPLRDEARTLVEEFADVLDKQLDPRGADLDEVHINLRQGAEGHLPNANARPVKPAYLDRLLQYFDDMKENGVVREAHGPVASPVVVVEKKANAEGVREIRPCGDYRAVNDLTVPDRFPMVDIRQFVQDLTGMKYFLTADILKGFHQQPMAEDSIYLTALIMPKRFVEFLFAPFGLRNLPAQFQRAVARILQPLAKDCVKNYVDDIFAAARTPEELLNKLKRLLHVLRERRIKLKPSKVYIGYDEVEVLGSVISRRGRSIVPARVRAIQDIPTPVNTTALKSFIGHIGFIAEFIPDCQTLLKPLHTLSAASEFTWRDEHTEAFNAIKDVLSSDTVLAHPNMDKPWHLQTDASLFGVGGILWQGEEDEDWEVVSYFSKCFTDTQTRWSTYDQELYGVLYCLTRADMAAMFRAHPNVTVFTDHKNLVALATRANESRRHQHWQAILQEYDMRIIHIPGVDNGVADFLSRHFAGTQANNTGGMSHAELIEEAHRYHQGINETVRQLQEQGHDWPLMREEVTRHIRNCVLCQKTRLSNFLKTNLGSTMRQRPFQTVAIDTVGPLPRDSRGNKYVFVCVCLGRHVHTVHRAVARARQQRGGGRVRHLVDHHHATPCSLQYPHG